MQLKLNFKKIETDENNTYIATWLFLPSFLKSNLFCLISTRYQPEHCHMMEVFNDLNWLYSLCTIVSIVVISGAFSTIWFSGP